MANAYSYDLRKRVVAAVDSGESRLKIARTYQVGRATIYRWLKRRKEVGDIAPKVGWRKGYGHKIQDLAAFKKFVEENPQRTLKEMARDWVGVKRTTISRALKKIGFTHKKNQLWLQRTSGTRTASVFRPLSHIR